VASYNPQEILRNFLADPQWEVIEQETHGRTYLPLPHNGVSKWKYLVEIIEHQGIEVKFA